jgi:hypothetical protein
MNSSVTARAGDGIARAILKAVARVPGSRRSASAAPGHDAQRLAREAATRAAIAAGGLSLPPGPLGWLTVVPELLAVWRIQSQMVADIAGLYGKEAWLSREQMLYCLFRHTAAQAVRDLVVRVGERYLVQRLSLGALQGLARLVGLRITNSLAGKGLSRLMPIVGAVGVGAYAWMDTTQVARTAMEMFERDLLTGAPVRADDQGA